MRYLSSASDISYEIGTTGHILSWHVWDYSPMLISYALFKDGQQIKKESLISEERPITYNVDGLQEGSYLYTIEIRHGSGENSSKSVWVTVVNTAPVFTIKPTDISFNYSSTGNILTWRFSDISTHFPTYTIRKTGLYWSQKRFVLRGWIFI